VHDAEDLVQETMLRAWQHFDTFKGSSSLRTWLYAIATHACLDLLKKRSTRTMPTFAFPAADPSSPIAPATPEAFWLEPFPDTWLADAVESPEARYTRRESISLAFLTVLQLLPPRQRAALILSDVLDWHASEVAHLLEMSVSAVNSVLHRARTTMAKNYSSEKREIALIEHTDTTLSALLSRYMHAWETDDIDGLVALLKEDATLSMPPFPSWYRGRESVHAILVSAPFGFGRRWHLHSTSANGQPAFAFYRVSESQNFYQAFGIQIITPDWSIPEGQIADMTIFKIPSLFPYFNLPSQLPI
jgi:RNA polymerase sigma-70 factor (ECF subfamily)